MNIKSIIILIALIVLTQPLFSYNKNVVKTTLRSVAEDIVTKSGVSLLSEQIQEEALKEQANSSEDNCLDDSCLMDTGKMLAAQMLFIVKISDMGKDNFMFKISYIDLETNENISTRSEFYTGVIDNTEKLFKFSKKFLSTMAIDLNKTQKKSRLAMIKIIFVSNNNNNENDKNKDIPKYIISFKTKYDPVNIYDGEKLLGISPLKTLIDSGEHKFSFEKKGYKIVTIKKSINQKLTIKEIPFKKILLLTINSEIKEGTLFIDGADYGDLDNGGLKVKLPIGKYTIFVKNDKSKTETETLFLKRNKKIFLEKLYIVKIKTKKESKLFLEDKYYGLTPLVFSIKKGVYKIKLHNETIEKEFKLNVSKSKEFYFPMDKKFNWVEFNLGTNYIHKFFSGKENNNHLLLGGNIKLFNWYFKYFNIDILGAGFYFGLNSYKLFKIHILNLDFKILKDLKIDLSLGPFLGDTLMLYDNKKDYYISYGGIDFKYNRKIMNHIYLNVEMSIYYGATNSQKSLYNPTDNSMDNGFIFSSIVGLNFN